MFVWAIRALKAVLVPLFGLIVMLQTLSAPGGFRYDAQQHPDQAYLQWPLTITVGSVFLAAEVVVVCVWRLLTHIARRQLLSSAALATLTAATWACAYAAAVLSALFAFMVAGADDPGGPVVMLFITLCVFVLTLLAYVLRTALAQAITER